VARAVALDDEREVPLAEARAVLLSEAPERE
jgi:hypothetical protein